MVSAHLCSIIPAFCEIADSSLFLVMHKGLLQSIRVALVSLLHTRFFNQFFNGIWWHQLRDSFWQVFLYQSARLAAW